MFTAKPIRLQRVSNSTEKSVWRSSVLKLHVERVKDFKA